MKCTPLFLAALAAAASTQSWQIRGTAGAKPMARSHGACVYDAATNTMIQFGGVSWPANKPVVHHNDVWYLTNPSGPGTARWTLVKTAGTPPKARQGFGWYFDAASSTLFIVGGFAEIPCGQLKDVWILLNANGVKGTPTWKQISATGTAPLRGHPAVGYDPSSNRLIVATGQSCSSFFNDVHVLTNANGQGGTSAWSKLATGGSAAPKSRSVSASVYEPASDRLLVIGGASGSGVPRLNDVWMLLNASGRTCAPSWQRVLPSGGTFPGRHNHTAVFDPASGNVYVFGGNIKNGLPGDDTNDLWVLAGAFGASPAWRLVRAASSSSSDPAKRGAHRAVWDPATQRMVICFGFSGKAPGGTQYDDVWVIELPNAQVSHFGRGCASTSEKPILRGSNAPRLGRTFTLDARGLHPNSAGQVIFGGSNRMWIGQRLPLNLAWLQAGNCDLLVSMDASLTVQTDATGASRTAFTIPANPALLGGVVYAQAWAQDLGANSLGIGMTDGLKASLGY